MMRRDNGLVGDSMPEVFCWTKFGTEAGEEPRRIFERKEIERRRNGGIFLWGIGSSIRPSLSSLLAITNEPEVIFSPMKTVAAKRDTEPAELVLWCDATGYDGLPYQLPDASLVTSRRDSSNPRSAHFALVCYRDSSLLSKSLDSSELPLEEVRNLRTGTPLGASQVTSVVRRVKGAGNVGSRYPVAVRAWLVYPFLVRLTREVAVPAELRLDHADGEALERNLDELIRIRCEASSLARPRIEQLALV